MHMDIEDFTMEELSKQEGSVLPGRHLMQTLTITVTVTIGVEGLPQAGLP